jgi:hypothetical protein
MAGIEGAAGDLTSEGPRGADDQYLHEGENQNRQSLRVRPDRARRLNP